jgi:hypothetical protein
MSKILICECNDASRRVTSGTERSGTERNVVKPSGTKCNET